MLQLEDLQFVWPVFLAFSLLLVSKHLYQKFYQRDHLPKGTLGNHNWTRITDVSKATCCWRLLCATCVKKSVTFLIRLTSSVRGVYVPCILIVNRKLPRFVILVLTRSLSFRPTALHWRPRELGFGSGNLTSSPYMIQAGPRGPLLLFWVTESRATGTGLTFCPRFDVS
uniref:Uncharacterized protein n=1 Tax=Cacopsylla melanoneura TaxID=428564 RepID=A0A8D8LR52_9HEMI